MFKFYCTGKKKLRFIKKDVTVLKEYDAEIDCQFYDELNTPISELTLEPSFMAVFFPNDIHGPICVYENQVSKI